MTAKETAEILDEASQVIEDTLDLMEAKVSWATSNPKAVAWIAFSAGLAIGAGASYLVVRKTLAAKYEKISRQEIDEVKAHYSAPRLVAQKPDLEELAEKIRDTEVAENIIEENGYVGYSGVEPTVEAPQTASELIKPTVVAPAPVETNVFDEPQDTLFDYELELARRVQFPLDPHVITFDEFNENETDFEQGSLTYFDGDDVLADSKDSPVPPHEIDRLVGAENLLRFGHGSNDPRIVYIRNPKLELDMEIKHSDGKFAKEVLGFDDSELRHSDYRRPRRFRHDDD